MKSLEAKIEDLITQLEQAKTDDMNMQSLTTHRQTLATAYLSLALFEIAQTGIVTFEGVNP